MTDLLDETEDDLMDPEEPSPKIWLYPFLADIGITRIEVFMSGSGDSGDINDVRYFRGEEIISPTLKNPPLWPPDSGVVLKWFVSEGMIVRAGDPICEVDPTHAKRDLVDAKRDLQGLLEKLAQLDESERENQDIKNYQDVLENRVRDLELRAQHTILTAPDDGCVNAFDTEQARKGYQKGERLLTLTPLTNIDTILEKFTIDDGTHNRVTFKDALYTLFETDGSAAGNWYDNEGGSVSCSYDLDPELGRIQLIDADYSPGEEYGDEEEDWEPELGEAEDEADEDVEP